jgi:hypothetical protein
MNIDRIINSLPIANLDETSTGFRPTVSLEIEFIAYRNGQILKSRDLDLIQSLFGDYARENDIKTDASAAYDYQTKGRMWEFNGFPSPNSPCYIQYTRSLLKTFKANCRANNIKIKVNTDNTGLHCHLKLLSINEGVSNKEFFETSRDHFHAHSGGYRDRDRVKMLWNQSTLVEPMVIAEMMKRYSFDQSTIYTFMRTCRNGEGSYSWAVPTCPTIQSLDVTTITDIVNLHPYTDGNDKYQALSLKKYSTFQTIEARQFHSTLEINAITCWALFLQNLLTTTIDRFQVSDAPITRTIDLSDNILDLPIPEGERAIRSDSNMIPLYNLIYNNEMNVNDIIAYMNIENSDPANKVRVYVCNLRDRLKLIYGDEIAGQILPTETFINNGARYRDGVRNSSYKINKTIEIQEANSQTVLVDNELTRSSFVNLPVDQLNFWQEQKEKARIESLKTIIISRATYR